MYSAQGVTTCWFTPTYSGFTSCLDQCQVFHRPLSHWFRTSKAFGHGLRGHGEEDRGQPHSHCTLFCSPHNPTGRVWERWELEKAREIFQRHGVYVISDEIWSDIIRPGQKHIPTQMVNSYAKEHTVALYAPPRRSIWRA